MLDDLLIIMQSRIHDETTCPENLGTVSAHTGNNHLYSNCKCNVFAAYSYLNANMDWPVIIGYKTGNIRVIKYI